MGRQPWIVQGLLKTADAHSPNVSTATGSRPASASSSLLYLALGIVDFVLMRRYARLDPPRGRGEDGCAASGGELLMDLADLLVRPDRRSLGGYFLLEGFDFGVGMLLPFAAARRARARRDVRVDRPGVGRQRGVARRRRAARRSPRSRPGTRRCSRASTSRCCSSSCFLIVRVVSFEWREKGDEPALADAWLWANTIGSVGAAFIWGVALANLLHGVPLDSNGDFTGDFLDLFSAYTVLAGLAVVLALRVPRRDAT